MIIRETHQPCSNPLHPKNRFLSQSPLNVSQTKYKYKESSGVSSPQLHRSVCHNFIRSVCLTDFKGIHNMGLSLMNMSQTYTNLWGAKNAIRTSYLNFFDKTLYRCALFELFTGDPAYLSFWHSSLPELFCIEICFKWSQELSVFLICMYITCNLHVVSLCFHRVKICFAIEQSYYHFQKSICIHSV